jgi:nicotinamide-nucleotide amidase
MSSLRTLTLEAKRLLALCRRRGLTLATAESCTGGLIAAILTEIPGSSDVVERGFVTYSNAAKSALLGVPAKLIVSHGAVSEIVARRMAEGGRRRAGVDLCIAVTGIAGPGGATAAKPVGLVHLAAARRGRTTAHKRFIFKGNRSAVRRQAVAAAFALLRRIAR